MPAVPVIIQRAEQEAQQEEGEKADAQELSRRRTFLQHREEYGQRHGGKAAVNIRQALHFVGSVEVSRLASTRRAP